MFSKTPTTESLAFQNQTKQGTDQKSSKNNSNNNAKREDKRRGRKSKDHVLQMGRYFLVALLMVSRYLLEEDEPHRERATYSATSEPVGRLARRLES